MQQEKAVDLTAELKRLDTRDDKQLIWQTLRGERRISRVALWFGEAAPPATPLPEGVLAGRTKLHLLVHLGDELDGHPGLVHGGFTAALLDDALGWCTIAERSAQGLDGMVLTANLNLNYRRPVEAGQAYLVEAEIDRIEKRKKVFLTARVLDAQRNVCVDATALYIVKAMPPEQALYY